MSMDSVDDLEHAEDLLGGAGLLDADYCRPTCQGQGEPCGDDCCGCPCHNQVRNLLVLEGKDGTYLTSGGGGQVLVVANGSGLVRAVAHEHDPLYVVLDDRPRRSVGRQLWEDHRYWTLHHDALGLLDGIDTDEPCPDDPDGLHHIDCGCGQ